MATLTRTRYRAPQTVSQAVVETRPVDPVMEIRNVRSHQFITTQETKVVQVVSEPLIMESDHIVLTKTAEWATHEFKNGPKKCPSEMNNLKFDGEIDRPPYTPPEGRYWNVYREDMAMIHEEHGLGLPLTMEGIADPDPTLPTVEITAGGESILFQPLNIVRTWQEAFKKREGWSCYFPGVPLDHGRTMEMTLTFTYDNTTRDFVLKSGGVGLELSFDGAQIRKYLGIDPKNLDPKILPLNIQVVEEHSQGMPTDMNACLVTRRSEGSGVTKRSDWFPPMGPAPEGDQPITHLVRKGTSDRNLRVTKFWSRPETLSAEFHRWVNTDFNALRAELDTPAFLDSSNNDARHISGIPILGFEPETHLQFLLLDEYHRIAHLTEAKKDNNTAKLLYKESSKDTAQFQVSNAVMVSLIDEKKKEVNADQNFMHLSHGMSLILKPIHSIEQQTSDMRGEGDRVYYSMTVFLRYCRLE